MFAAPSIVNPSEILSPPVGHWLNSYTVYTSTNDYPYQIIGDFTTNYLNLIVTQSATNSTLLDGIPVAATNFTAIGSSGYYGAQITVTNSGAHTVTSSKPVEVQVYGWGGADAYGYFGGLINPP
jgi:hypothetical protein